MKRFPLRFRFFDSFRPFLLLLPFLLFLPFLFILGSCDKGATEPDIVIVPDPPTVQASATNSAPIPYNTSATIVYSVVGDFDSIKINSQKVYASSGNYQTPKLVNNTTFTVCAFGPGGNDEVTVLIPVADPVPSLEVTISSRSIEWDGTVGFTWKYSYLTKCTLNGVQISSPGSRNIVLKNDSTFVFVGIPINGDTIRQTYVVEVGAKPNWKTFLEIGLDVVWKEYQVYYIPEGSSDWELLTLNNNIQVIFNQNGTTTVTLDTGSSQGTWSILEDILNFMGEAQIQSISDTELILYYEKKSYGTTWVPYKFIYKKL